MLIDSQQLRSFVSVVELGSVSRAAEAVHLTQSAVSAQIKRLERHLRCRLLARTTRSVRPTPQGEILLGYARSILTLNEQASFRLGATHPTLESVRLGLSEGFPIGWLFRTVAAFRERYPEIELRIVSGNMTELSELVRSRSLDIVVGGHCGKAVVGDVLWREPLVWAFSDRAALDPLRPIPVAFLAESCPFREAALAALSLHGRAWRVVLTSPSGARVLAAAAAGLATTPIIASVMTSNLRAIPGGCLLPELPTAEIAMQVRSGRLGEQIAELSSDIRRACHRWLESSPVEPDHEMAGA